MKTPNMLDAKKRNQNDIKYVKYISRICQPNTNRFSYKGNVYRLLDENGNIIEKNVNKKS